MFWRKLCGNKFYKPRLELSFVPTERHLKKIERVQLVLILKSLTKGVALTLKPICEKSVALIWSYDWTYIFPAKFGNSKMKEIHFIVNIHVYYVNWHFLILTNITRMPGWNLRML